LVVGLEALTHVAELGQDLGGADRSGAGKGHDDASIRQGGNGVLDPAGELAELLDEGR
jgi:hypothetical protein